MKEVNQTRGIVIRFKEKIPERFYRALTKPVSLVLRAVPTSLKYSIGLKQRRGNYPYCLVNQGDVVVQVGAPRDLLKVGRSRTIYFLNLVGDKGKVIVFEPDPDSIAALKSFAKSIGLADRLTLIEKGAWNESTELVFLSSPTHPAANLIQGAQDVDPAILQRRQYREIRVPVTAIDEAFAAESLPFPKLVSITANGSEPQILEGMKEMISNGLRYLALAITGENYPEKLDKIGYDLIALDDRGFTFENRELSTDDSATQNEVATTS
ncbi:MAG: FkbM family methyltransferase [Rubripirellula sp.]